MKINSRTALAVLGLILFLGCRLAPGQNGGSPGSPRLTPQNAANSWRFVAIDPAKQSDTLNPEIRQERTAFWAKTLANFAEIPGRIHGEMTGGATNMSRPEFYKAPGELWCTGTFLSYKVFPIPSINLAYTEIQFLVQSVISQNPPAGLAAGKVITIDLPGGTLLEGGQPVSHFLTPEPFSVEMGHSYLIQTFYNSVGNFYSGVRSWDITSGTVVPNGKGDFERGKLGTSQIDGTPADEIIQRMKIILVTR